MLGIKDRTWPVVDARAFSRSGMHNDLKQKIAEHRSTHGTLRDIHEVDHPDCRALMLEIPAAPREQAVASRGHACGSCGETLGALPLNKLDNLPFPLLSDALSAEQKCNEAHNLRRARTITNAETDANPAGHSFDTPCPESSIQLANPIRTARISSPSP